MSETITREIEDAQNEVVRSTERFERELGEFTDRAETLIETAKHPRDAVNDAMSEYLTAKRKEALDAFERARARVEQEVVQARSALSRETRLAMRHPSRSLLVAFCGGTVLGLVVGDVLRGH